MYSDNFTDVIEDRVYINRELLKNTDIAYRTLLQIRGGRKNMMDGLKKSMKSSDYILPENLRGRSIHTKVIPTVCNLKNMLHRLMKVHGDFEQLKQWEKRSYKAYLIEQIKDRIMTSPQFAWKDIVREHILSSKPCDLGASVIGIYLVAYVVETIGIGKDEFFKYIKHKGISDKNNSAQAIWQVGKGDGVYLEILNDNGQVMDWDFIMKWVEGKQ